jgi:tripeptidyl-peptidase I
MVQDLTEQLTIVGPEKGRTEVACQSNSGSAFTTGGGFSNLYQAPVWQKETIEKYFTAIAFELPYVNESRVREGDNGFPCPQYNPKGRGYPDISMLGELSSGSCIVDTAISVVHSVV